MKICQIFFFFPKRKEKKCYPLSFPILGGRDSTRALQSTSSPESLGGTPERDTVAAGVVVVVAGQYFSFPGGGSPERDTVAAAGVVVVVVVAGQYFSFLI